MAVEGKGEGLEPPGGWGTWEELVLGGAVLRHGASAWRTVAAELRCRSRSASSFSPEECEAKFLEIQARYSASDAWFEELRKQRVAELKREPEKSENSIGSLQSMIESLSNSRHDDGNSGCQTGHTQSCSRAEDTPDTNSSSKSKDRSSAASFTEEASNSCATQVQLLDRNSIQLNNTSPETLLNSQEEKQDLVKYCWIWGSRKKRGRRNRKLLVMGDNSSGDGATSTACIEREGSSEGCMKDLKTPHIGSGTSMNEITDINLAEILKTISMQADCSMLQHRLDIQRRRVRYKKMIRQHMDLRVLNSKIKSGAISSTKELLRDILLFVNNVLAFYPKATLEHMAAVALRDLACKTVQQSSSFLSKNSGIVGTANSPMMKMKKARTLQGGPHGPCGATRTKIPSRDAGNTIPETEGNGSRRDLPASADARTNKRGPPGKKRGVGRPPKSGQKRVAAEKDSPNKGRKRSRR